MFKTAGEIFQKTIFAKLPKTLNNTFWPRDIFNFRSKFSIFEIFEFLQFLQILNPTDFQFLDP